jgi:hypothetical protein
MKAGTKWPSFKMVMKAIVSFTVLIFTFVVILNHNSCVEDKRWAYGTIAAVLALWSGSGQAITKQILSHLFQHPPTRRRRNRSRNHNNKKVETEASGANHATQNPLTVSEGI